MRIYIVEDDTSVIGILEDIVEGNELGVVCGDSGGEPANLGQILALGPRPGPGGPADAAKGRHPGGAGAEGAGLPG